MKSTRSRFTASVLALLSISLLCACNKHTNEVPIGHVGLDFIITLNEFDSMDDHGDPINESRFHLSGDLFTVSQGDISKLFLAKNERLTISDGVNEHDVDTSYHMFTEHFFFYFPDAEPFQQNAPYYILRYYRRDGEILESRIETPALPEFVAPERNREWLPREQVLDVEWTESLVPIHEVVLESWCRVPDENGEMDVRIPVSGITQLQIDLTAEPHEENCSVDYTHIRLIQAPVSASSIDSRFLGESRFELQRQRERDIRERT